MLMLVAQSEVGAVVGVTIIVVSFWRMAERRGHGRGGHFAPVPPAPLASSSHCPFSASCPGLGRLCSSSSSMAKWCSCFVLSYVFVFDGLLEFALCIPFARGFGGVSDGRFSWPSRSSSSCRRSETGRSRGARECADHEGHLSRRLQWLVHRTSMTS